MAAQDIHIDDFWRGTLSLSLSLFIKSNFSLMSNFSRTLSRRVPRDTCHTVEFCDGDEIRRGF